MLSNANRATLALLVLAFARPILAQQPATIAIRAVRPPSATSPSIRYLGDLREIAGGRVLIVDGGKHALTVFDSTLQQPTIVADTLGMLGVYPQFGKLIPYTADSSLFYESDSRSLELIDPKGRFVRVLALPHPQDFNLITSGSPVGTDGGGHLVYQGHRQFGSSQPCWLASDGSVVRPPPEPPMDSVAIIRADFETRTADTVARARTSVVGTSIRVTTAATNCTVTSAKMRVNPSIPPADSWTVTARGTIAIVRGHDYHIDWISPDGTTRSTPKMPFDWRRLTDADKQAKIDSAKRIIDSITARGGYQLRACSGNGSSSTSFSADAPSVPTGGAAVSGGSAGGAGGGGGGRAGGGRGDGPPGGSPMDCQTVTVAAEFAPLDSMADYITPIRERSARADLDGNVWILPTTSAAARGGLLYDVVNPAGELFERVQLPAGRDIAGFGHGSVVYLLLGDYRVGYVIEKVKVLR